MIAIEAKEEKNRSEDTHTAMKLGIHRLSHLRSARKSNEFPKVVVSAYFMLLASSLFLFPLLPTEKRGNFLLH